MHARAPILVRLKQARPGSADSLSLRLSLLSGTVGSKILQASLSYEANDLGFPSQLEVSSGSMLNVSIGNLFTKFYVNIVTMSRTVMVLKIKKFVIFCVLKWQNMVSLQSTSIGSQTQQ